MEKPGALFTYKGKDYDVPPPGAYPNIDDASMESTGYLLIHYTELELKGLRDVPERTDPAKNGFEVKWKTSPSLPDGLCKTVTMQNFRIIISESPSKSKQMTVSAAWVGSATWDGKFSDDTEWNGLRRRK
jgi:hypothetical protein